MPLPPVALPRPQQAAEGPDVLTIHRQYADFVWRTLQRFGVHDADVEDTLQEVFVVVHRRLASLDGSARVTSWLYGICLRVALAYRRRAHRRRERLLEEPPEPPTSEDASPEQLAIARQAQARLRATLDSMEIEKRAIFVMYEIDEMSCEEIASILSIPLGTVYSRLHASREAFRKALERVAARDASLRSRSGGRA